MPAPTPADIVANPPPLNSALATWPFVIDRCPLRSLLFGFLGAPKVAGSPAAEAAATPLKSRHQQ